MSNFASKWTVDQEKLYREGLEKYGQNWSQVKKYMKNQRSNGSLIRKWYTYPDQKFKKKITSKQGNKFEEQNVQIQKKSLKSSKKEDSLISEDLIQKLLKQIIEEQDINWNSLSLKFGMDIEKLTDIWIKQIYPKYVYETEDKIGHALKWTNNEDKILYIGTTQNIDWQIQAKRLLPNRSIGSIRTRWRRIEKNYVKKNKAKNVNRHLLIRQTLKKIAKINRENKENGIILEQSQ